MLNSLAEPKRFASKTMTGNLVDISVWRSDGSILELRNCISMRYNFYGGWRDVKIFSTGECRKIRDCCIFRVNDLEVFL